MAVRIPSHKLPAILTLREALRVVVSVSVLGGTAALCHGQSELQLPSFPADELAVQLSATDEIPFPFPAREPAKLSHKPSVGMKASALLGLHKHGVRPPIAQDPLPLPLPLPLPSLEHSGLPLAFGNQLPAPEMDQLPVTPALPKLESPEELGTQAPTLHISSGLPAPGKIVLTAASSPAVSEVSMSIRDDEAPQAQPEQEELSAPELIARKESSDEVSLTSQVELALSESLIDVAVPLTMANDPAPEKIVGKAPELYKPRAAMQLDIGKMKLSDLASDNEPVMEKFADAPTESEVPHFTFNDSQTPQRGGQTSRKGSTAVKVPPENQLAQPMVKPVASDVIDAPLISKSPLVATEVVATPEISLIDAIQVKPTRPTTIKPVSPLSALPKSPQSIRDSVVTASTLADSKNPSVPDTRVEEDKFAAARSEGSAEVSQRYHVGLNEAVNIESLHLVDNVSIEHPEVCQLLKGRDRDVTIVGMRSGKTRVAVFTTNRIGERKMEMYEVTVGNTMNQPGDSRDLAAEVTRTLRQMFPRSHVEVIADSNGLAVQGAASSEDEAKKIISLVRKTSLLPVSDRVTSYK
jgi:hypothetical protein